MDAGAAVELELPRGREAPSIARREIVRWFGTTLDARQLQTATLLTSELVSNAVRHGKGSIKLEARIEGDNLMVEVIDEGTGLGQTLRERNLDDLDGFGLRIVDRESRRWGAHDGTTHVWFELARRRPNA